MPTILDFTYDGTVKVLTATENCTIDFTLQGAGGGGGGADSNYGTNGHSGDTVTGRVSLNKDESIYLAVGSGGQGGVGRYSGYPGGVGGYALQGYAGGTGGSSGGSGTSGSGGGGGGATVLFRADGTPIAVAGGGGGGSGGGNHGGGYIYSYSAYGKASDYSLTYYTTGSTDNAWSSLLNNNSIWNGNGTYNWEVYFPQTADYSFSISIDNTGNISIDGTEVIATTGGESSRYGTVYSKTRSVTAGWHTVTMTGTNWGGPAALGGIIKRGESVIWTTRSARNARTVQLNRGRGGHGGNKRGDGGGGGGGGGGYYGGCGGSTRSGDIGGYAGSIGYSYTENTGPWNAASSSYGYGGGHGGLGSGSRGGYGGNGYAAFRSVHTDVKIRKTLSIWIAQYSFYQVPYDVYVKQNGIWKPTKEILVKNNGVWKKTFGETLPTYYSSNNWTFDNTSGA